MLRRKLEPKIDELLGEKLMDSQFLARVRSDYGKRLTNASKRESSGVDRSAIMRKLEELGAKKGRVLDAFYDGIIDRTRRDKKLQELDLEIGSYDVLLGNHSPVFEPPAVPSPDAVLRVIEPLGDWEFLSRDDRRVLLRQLCPEISVYQYTVKSLTLNLDTGARSADGYTGSHSRMAP